MTDDLMPPGSGNNPKQEHRRDADSGSLARLQKRRQRNVKEIWRAIGFFWWKIIVEIVLLFWIGAELCFNSGNNRSGVWLLVSGLAFLLLYLVHILLGYKTLERYSARVWSGYLLFV